MPKTVKAEPCQWCRGTGVDIDPQRACGHCAGTGEQGGRAKVYGPPLRPYVSPTVQRDALRAALDGLMGASWHDDDCAHVTDREPCDCGFAAAYAAAERVLAETAP